MIASVMAISRAAARLSMNGNFGVRIMCTTSVCVSMPATNQLRVAAQQCASQAAATTGADDDQIAPGALGLLQARNAKRSA